MIFRQFCMNDLPKVFSLAVETLKEDYSPQFLVDLYSYWPDGFIVIEERGEIIGFVAGILMSRKYARILMLGVRPDVRRRGYGTMLCRHFLRNCVLRGIRIVTLEVRASNLAAIALYSKMGFNRLNVIDHYYTDGEDAFKMQIML